MPNPNIKISVSSYCPPTNMPLCLGKNRKGRTQLCFFLKKMFILFEFGLAFSWDSILKATVLLKNVALHSKTGWPVLNGPTCEDFSRDFS